MGVLYAKVAGAWEPIIGGGGGGGSCADCDAHNDARYVNVGGDTMTGAVGVPTINDLGAVNGLGTNPIDLRTGGAQRMRLEGTTGATGAVAIGDPATSGNNAHYPLRIHGNASGGRLAFWIGPNPQSQSGTVGFSSATAMQLSNAVSSGTLNLFSDGATTFTTGGTETARIAGSSLLVATTSGSIPDNLPGIIMNTQVVCSANDLPNTGCIIANKVGAGVASGHSFVQFRNNNTGIGSITRNVATAAVLYNTTSDYRVKDDHGPITDAAERVKRLVPRRVVWHEDESQTEMDGFFAHEVAEAVPEAVTGEKDAVVVEEDIEQGRSVGDIVPQQLDPSKMMPLLTAALQEALARIEVLESQIT